MQRIEIRVDGMSCASCVGRIEKALMGEPGVAEAQVNLATGKATVEFDQPTTPAMLIDSIKEAGYQPRLQSAEIPVVGMSCGSCVSRIEQSLNKQPGMVKASVNLTTRKAFVEFLSDTLSVPQTHQAIRDAGYEPQEPDASSETEEQDREGIDLRRKVLFAAALTIPVVLIAMGKIIPALEALYASLLPHRGWMAVEWLLTTPVMFYAGARFFRSGYVELRHASPGMNSLVMIGTSAAYFYSVAALFVPGFFPAGTAQSYFEAAAVIVTLILLGRYFEHVAKGRTSEAIKKLLQLQAKTARVIRDGDVVEVPIEAVVPGDRIQVRPGERVPVDGVVEEGQSYVDESMISGEPVPVAKQKDAELVGGTINKNGSLTFRATRVGADTVLAQIIRMVESAQADKPPIQALADKIAGIFVPIVIVLAILTFITWFSFGPAPALSFAFVTTVSVLLIACPCAMGLATPTAIMVGTGKGAEMGVLFRKGAALETLSRMDTIVLDKTGTLTRGELSLVDTRTFGNLDADRCRQLAASLEKHSEHPIARVFHQIPGYAARQVQNHLGGGLSGQVDGAPLYIGHRDFVEEKVGSPAPEADTSKGMEIWLATDRGWLARFTLDDEPRPDAREAVQALQNAGLRTILLSGDRSGHVEQIAGRLGIDEAIGQASPEEKLRVLENLRDQGHHIMMVGDGLNDLPSMAGAGVSVAMGSAADLTQLKADAVLLSGQLTQLSEALKAGQDTRRVIRQNMAWALAYNVCALPLAAAGLVPPWLAAIGMSLSSLVVVLNAMRLGRQRGNPVSHAPAVGAEATS